MSLPKDDAAALAARWTDGVLLKRDVFSTVERGRFHTDAGEVDAVLRRLETLADAARHLSPELTARHSTIPWRAIYGFRNVAAHGDVGLDLARVWATVQDYLPALDSVVAEELRSFDR